MAIKISIILKTRNLTDWTEAFILMLSKILGVRKRVSIEVRRDGEEKRELNSRLTDLRSLAGSKGWECREDAQTLEDWRKDVDVVELVAVEAREDAGWGRDEAGREKEVSEGDLSRKRNVRN